MKKNKINLALASLMVVLPFIALMIPTIIDLSKCVLNQPKQNTEINKISCSGQKYGYNPSYKEEHEISVLKTVAYCSCEKCCGWNTGITYSGTKAKQGKTIAANLSAYPINTKIIIDGNEYIVEDTGQLPEYLLDIYFESHDEALKYGSKWKAVKIIK